MSFLEKLKSLFTSHASQTGLDFGLGEGDRAKLKSADPNIVVGQILTIEPHPDPKITKVRVTTCNLGDGKTAQVLCGGTNIEVEQVVPVAKVGAVLPGNFEIGVREIRGVESHGMICAQSELGLTAEKEEKGQIWPLPSEFGNHLGTSICHL